MAVTDSRKYKLALIAFALVALGWLATSTNNVLSEGYGELIAGIMSVLVLYYSGNVGSKYVATKYKHNSLDEGGKQ